MKIAILGYGNLGKGIESAIRQNDDMELVAVFTRRAPESVSLSTNAIPVVSVDDIEAWKDKVDVLVICGGSATDLPVQTPKYASMFNVIDSFDTHARIPEHFENVNKNAMESKHTALISCGWDPGMFSLNRLYGNVILPEGNDYTFWGKGVSQGHSDAIRRIDGVIDARQYTIPIEEAMERVRNGETPAFVAREKHLRECFVVVEDGADKDRIEQEIKSMPNYFDEYDTTVHFISEDEMKKNHSELPHGGVVLRSGITGLNKEHKHVIEYKLQLDSNPEFTASVILAFARAVNRFAKMGDFGCKSVFDVPPAYLSPLSGEELRKKLL